MILMPFEAGFGLLCGAICLNSHSGGQTVRSWLYAYIICEHELYVLKKP